MTDHRPAPRTERPRPGEPLLRWRAHPPPTLDEERAMVAAMAPGLAPPLDRWAFVTEDRLLADTRVLAAALPPGVDLVVGIVRSGMLVAPWLATWLHLPLRAVSQPAGVTDPGHGGRMVGRDHHTPRHVLLVDDTVATGREMRACAAIVRAAYPRARLTRAVVYANPRAAASVDLFVAAYPGRHYLGWNWNNAGHAQACAFDFDGILCRDFTAAECATPASYRAAMGSIPPLYLPRRRRVPLVVTARHESHRAASEAWLSRHGVAVDRLVMRVEGGPDNHAHDAADTGRWKAAVFGASRCSLFAESDPAQARIIADFAGRPVLCPAAGRVFAPLPWASDPRMPLVNACPDRGCRTGCGHALCNRHHREAHVSECLACVSTPSA